MFNADRLKIQVLQLKKDNAMLSKRLEVIEKDNVLLKKKHRQEIDKATYSPSSKVDTIMSRENTPCNQEDTVQEDETGKDKELKVDTSKDSAISMSAKINNDTSIVEYIADKMDNYMSAFTKKIQPLIRAEIRRLCERERDNNNFSGNATNTTTTNLDLNNLRTFPPLSARGVGYTGSSTTSSPREGNARPSPLLIGSRVKHDNKYANTNTKAMKEEVILLQILDNNVSFKEVLSHMKSRINLRKEIGVDSLCISRSAKGGGVFSLAGQDSLRQLDLLAECMIKVLDKYKGKVKVIRPNKNNMDVIVSGRGDFVTCDEVASAVATVGGCDSRRVHVGKFKHRTFGRWSVRVACPTAVGNSLCNMGSLQLGWGRAIVRLAPPPLVRCYRCLRTGHMKASCRELVDRSYRCFKCGSNDHVISKCISSIFKCPLCIDLVNTYNHRLGDSKCVCPDFEGYYSVDTSADCSARLYKRNQRAINTISETSETCKFSNEVTLSPRTGASEETACPPSEVSCCPDNNNILSEQNLDKPDSLSIVGPAPPPDSIVREAETG